MGNSLRFPTCPDEAAAPCPPVTLAEFNRVVSRLGDKDALEVRGVALLVYMRAVAWVYRSMVAPLTVSGPGALTKVQTVAAQGAFVAANKDAASFIFTPEGRHLEGTGAIFVPNSGKDTITDVGPHRVFGGALRVVPVHLGSGIEAAEATAMMKTFVSANGGATLFVGDFNLEASKLEKALSGAARVVYVENGATTVKIRGVAANLQLGKAFEVAKKNIDYAVLYGGEGIGVGIEIMPGALMTTEIASDHYPIKVTLTKDGQTATLISWNAFGNTLSQLDGGIALKPTERSELAFSEFLPPTAVEKTEAYKFVSTGDGEVADQLRSVDLAGQGTLYDYAMFELRRENKKRGVSLPKGAGKKDENPISVGLAKLFDLKPKNTKFFEGSELLSRPEMIFPVVRAPVGRARIVEMLRDPFKLIMHAPFFDQGADDTSAFIRYSVEEEQENRQKWMKQITDKSVDMSFANYFYTVSELWKTKAAGCG